jgi:hypothetical protein
MMVTRSRASVSSSADGSKPRCSTIDAPAASADTASANWAQWNSGRMPEKTSLGWIPRLAMFDTSAACTERCECIAPFGRPVVPLV